MAKMQISTKRLQIDKANYVMVVAVSVAVFLTIFSLVTCKALFSQRSYQAKVIDRREKARDQLASNVKAADQLKSSYERFVNVSANVIGGAAVGNGDKDGDNARVVLDALPGQYDFPALATSLEKIAKDNNVKVGAISGTDDELNQSANTATANPQPVEIPFTMSVTTSYSGTKTLIDFFERSIRPFAITKLQISAGTADQISLDMTAKTYYQPGKSLNVTSEVVK